MFDLKHKLRHAVIRCIKGSVSNIRPEKRRQKAADLIRDHFPLVLMYHSVVPEYTGEKYTVSTSTVEQNIVDLLEDGYSFAFEDAFFRCKPQSVILTLDDGFANNYTEVFPLLQKYNVKASINIIADRISDPEGKYLSKEQICEMEESGLIQFQSHTCSHRSLDGLTLEEIRFELAESKQRLQTILKNKVSVFVYPREDFTEDIAYMASEYYDLCYGWAGEMQIDRRYTLPRIEILEGDSDYAYHILCERRIDNYHKTLWQFRKNKSRNVYRRVLFS